MQAIAFPRNNCKIVVHVKLKGSGGKRTTILQICFCETNKFVTLTFRAMLLR